MGIVEVVSPELGRIGHFSRAVEAQGRLIFLSGQAPIDPATGSVPTEFADQVGVCLTKMGYLLEAAGGGLADLARLTFYVVGRERLGELAAARALHLNVDPLPTMSAVVVDGLLDPQWLVEVDGMAAISP
jgi:2-iminobutanoate/2-iminopropanoate deaminase